MVDNGMNKDYLSWEEAYIGLCRLFALRSKHPIDKEACCVVNDNHKLLALGYNGLPLGCSDKKFSLINRDGSYNKRASELYFIPAIVNAALIAKYDLKGCTIYSTLFPCYDSVIAIIQRGIKQIYYVSDRYAHLEEYQAAKRMLDTKGVIYKPIDDVIVDCEGKNRLTWEQSFVGLGKVFAMRSKDPITQVGGVIVDSDNRIISIGYNGLPDGCEDQSFPWYENDESFYDDKGAYVAHGEANGVYIAGTRDLSNCAIYTTLFPCHKCAQKIIQSKIRRVYYVSDKYAYKDSFIASKDMLKDAKVKFKQVDDIEVTVKTKTLTIRR